MEIRPLDRVGRQHPQQLDLCHVAGVFRTGNRRQEFRRLPHAAGRCPRKPHVGQPGLAAHRAAGARIGEQACHGRKGGGHRQPRERLPLRAGNARRGLADADARPAPRLVDRTLQRAQQAGDMGAAHPPLDGRHRLAVRRGDRRCAAKLRGTERRRPDNLPARLQHARQPPPRNGVGDAARRPRRRGAGSDKRQRQTGSACHRPDGGRAAAPVRSLRPGIRVHDLHCKKDIRQRGRPPPGTGTDGSVHPRERHVPDRDRPCTGRHHHEPRRKKGGREGIRRPAAPVRLRRVAGILLRPGAVPLLGTVPGHRDRTLRQRAGKERPHQRPDRHAPLHADDHAPQGRTEDRFRPEDRLAAQCRHRGIPPEGRLQQQPQGILRRPFQPQHPLPGRPRRPRAV